MKVPLNDFEEWLRNKNLKERTIENYIYYFNKFTFDVFNQETVSKFLSLKSNRNSIGRSFLVNFQRFLRINYKALGFPEEYKTIISDVELPKLTGRVKERIIIPIPHEHISIIERYLKTEQLKLQLLLSYYCALRLGELLKISIISFDWDKWKKDTSLMGECRVYGKGDKEGIALVPSALMIRTAKYIKSKKFSSVDSKLFIRDNEKGDIRNRGRLFQMRLRNAGIDSGLTKFDAKGKVIAQTVIHPHRLRHSYASYLINVKKMDIRKVKEVLRHTSINSTVIYTHIDKEDLKRELSK